MKTKYLLQRANDDYQENVDFCRQFCSEQFAPHFQDIDFIVDLKTNAKFLYL